MRVREFILPVVACAALFGGVLSGPARAQGWIETAAPAYRAANVVAARIVTNEVNDTYAMIQCAAGDVRLVLGGTGGEPPEGPATVRAGQVQARTNFIADPALSKLIGNPATSALVPGDLLGEMAKSRSLSVVTTMRFGNGQVSNQSSSIPLSGFGRLMPVLREECLGEVRQAARAVEAAQTPAPLLTPAPLPAAQPPALSSKSAQNPFTAVAVLPEVQALLDRYAQACRDSGGDPQGFRREGIQVGDFNGDGVTDSAYHLGGYSCPGGKPGAGFCGPTGMCSVDVLMSTPQGHREVEGWTGVLDIGVGHDGDRDILVLRSRLEGGGTMTSRHRWNGRAFVRM
jgi:hypothetical protein